MSEECNHYSSPFFFGLIYFPILLFGFLSLDSPPIIPCCPQLRKSVLTMSFSLRSHLPDFRFSKVTPLLGSSTRPPGPALSPPDSTFFYQTLFLYLILLIRRQIVSPSWAHVPRHLLHRLAKLPLSLPFFFPTLIPVPGGTFSLLPLFFSLKVCRFPFREIRLYFQGPRAHFLRLFLLSFCSTQLCFLTRKTPLILPYLLLCCTGKCFPFYNSLGILRESPSLFPPSLPMS